MTLRERVEALAQQLRTRADVIRDKARRTFSAEYNNGRANELEYVIALVEETLNDEEEP